MNKIALTLIMRDSLTDAISRKEYWLTSTLHRNLADEPAWIERDPTTRILVYILDNRLHRDAADGPASIRYDVASDTVTREEYWQKGTLHRDPADGPALIERDPATGAVTLEEYWLNGQPVPAPARPSVTRAARPAEAARPANG